MQAIRSKQLRNIYNCNSYTKKLTMVVKIGVKVERKTGLVWNFVGLQCGSHANYLARLLTWTLLMSNQSRVGRNLLMSSPHEICELTDSTPTFSVMITDRARAPGWLNFSMSWINRSILFSSSANLFLFVRCIAESSAVPQGGKKGTYDEQNTVPVLQTLYEHERDLPGVNFRLN